MSARHRRRSQWGVGIILAGSTIVLSPVVGASPNSAALNSVRAAALATLREGSAQVQFRGSTTVVGGAKSSITGGGVLDFTHQLNSFTLSIAAGPTTVVEKLVGSPVATYLSVTDNGTDVVKTLTAKSWVRVTSTTTSAPASFNLLLQTQALTQPGVAVRALGTSSLDGQPVTGYRVTIPAKVLLALSLQRLKSLHLSAASLALVERATLRQGSQQVSIWVNSHHFIVEESAYQHLGLGASAVTSTVATYLSHFGAPVSVSIPSASDSVTYATFLREAKKYLG